MNIYHPYLYSFARLIIAYGFYRTCNDENGMIFYSTSQWFESFNIPFATLGAYIVIGAETLGVVFLVLGFLTRIISIPL